MVVNVYEPNPQEAKGVVPRVQDQQRQKENKQTVRMLSISTESGNVHRSLPLLITWYLRYLLSAIKTATARWR